MTVTVTETLERLQDALVQRFGRKRRRPKDRRSPEWALVQGLIGSRMPSEASSAVADRVLAECGSWDAVADLAPDALAKALKGVRFPNQSARRVHGVLGAIREKVGRIDLSLLEEMDTPAAVAWLEALPGAGPKIAAQVVNTTTLDRPALVLDTHHLRILARLGLIGEGEDTGKVYARLMPLLPAEWDAATIDEHHQLMKELGREICTPKAPGCADCPALSLCPTGQART
ncbi:endonuclease III [Tsuneonella sp. YG55]|uniref:Endonuclease III n=1 Tax=Tsuneonella litorea TaxID=2976475 RepID=A0A9X3A902_9SPHN|nr:endonuclease III [Tsuneonella litorea]MCT2559981.1 endonuclease III [Tsuneonella litorea]